MENQINYVELTETRLARFSGVIKLKTMVLQVFFGSCDPNAICTTHNYIEKKLSPATRDDVLQELLVNVKINSLEKGSTDIQKLAKLVPYLLSSMTKNLDLRDLVFLPSSDNVNQKSIDELLYAAVYHAPNLERLYYKKGPVLQYSDFAGHSSLLGSLSSFRNLQILAVHDLTINFKNLMILCQRLSNLRILSIAWLNYNEIRHPVSEEEISTSLGHLRLLCIENTRNSNLQAEMMIQKSLPNLDIVRVLSYTGLTFDDFLYPEVEGRSESQRKIFTCDRSWFENPDSNIHLKHPNVVHLNVDSDGAFRIDHHHLVLPNFANIKSIVIDSRSGYEFHTDFNESDTLDVERLENNVVLKYGKHLLSLSIIGLFEKGYTVQTFLQHCPKLENLKLTDVCANDRYLQLDNYSNLQNLRLVYNSDPKLNLLMAPQLKKVEIWTSIMQDDPNSVADFKNISTLIAEKKILLELQVLVINVGQFTPSICFTSIADMVKNASAFLPKLVDLKFNCEFDNYEVLARKMKKSEECKKSFFLTKRILDDLGAVFVDDELIETLALYRNRKCSGNLPSRH